MMNGEHGGERQSVRPHVNRDQPGRPVVQMQYLGRGRQSPRQFERRFREENETSGVILIERAMLAVDSWSIEKMVAPDEKKLHAAGAVTFEIFGDVRFFADANIDRYAGIFLGHGGIFPDLTIERNCYRHFVTELAELMWQCIEHIDQRTGVLQRRSFCADHQYSHNELMFDVRCPPFGRIRPVANLLLTVSLRSGRELS